MTIQVEDNKQNFVVVLFVVLYRVAVTGQAAVQC